MLCIKGAHMLCLKFWELNLNTQTFDSLFLLLRHCNYDVLRYVNSICLI